MMGERQTRHYRQHQKGEAASTNIHLWSRYRGDHTLSHAKRHLQRQLA